MSANAWDEARALGHGWVGPSHFFLAILAFGDATLAGRALAQLGIEHDAFARSFEASEASGDASDDPPTEAQLASPSMVPAAYAIVGRAEGLAAGLGAATPTAEHYLMACIWDPWTSVEVEPFGVTREEVIDRLAALGVPTPTVPIQPRPAPSGAKVFIPCDGTMKVVDALLARLPGDSGIGFNWDREGRAWVSARWDIDLPPLVDAVLDELGLDPVPQPDL